MPHRSINDRMSVHDCFTGLAATYAEHRPTYPAAAIEFMLQGLPAAALVIDVGCGTGISTRLLATAGATVIGIDPNDDMLAQAASTPFAHADRITYQRGSAEHTNLPNAAAHLVLCAQSFHWVNAADALREFHRILKPHGRLALMWNVQNPVNDFTRAYYEVVDIAQEDAHARGVIVRNERAANPTLGGYFANVRRASFSNTQRLTLAGAVGRAASASYFPKQDPLRTELQRRLTDAFNRNAVDAGVDLCYTAEVTLADRVANHA